jgi:hypothetical protein
LIPFCLEYSCLLDFLHIDFYNGHYYEYVQTEVEWSSALSSATSARYRGVAGHLVTVTSSGENSFLQGLSLSCCLLCMVKKDEGT